MTIETAGTGMVISLLIAVGVNLLVSILSSGSMEIMWSFLNVVQIMNYIPILSLNFPNILTLMFSYLKIANSDIALFEKGFRYLFNLNAETFPGDNAIN